VAKLCLVIYIPVAFAWSTYYRYGGSGKAYTALLCYTWVAMSLGMNTINKTLVMYLNTPCLITASQMAMAALFMAMVHGRKVQRCIKQYPQQALRWLIVPLVFSSMLMSSVFTFKYMSLSVMTVVRNLAPLFALPVELSIMAPQNRPTVSTECIGAMVVMLAGAVVYGFSAPVISAVGVAFAFMNMVLAVIDRMLQRKLLAQDCQDLRLEVCTFLNNFVGMFPSLAVALVTHEASNLHPHHAAAWYRSDTVMMLLMSGLLGIGMSYFGLAVQRSISGTSFLVLNNVSKVAVVTIGVAVFGDVFKSEFTKAGLLLSLGGSCWYGASHIKEGSRAATKSDMEGVHKPLVSGQRDNADGLPRSASGP